MKTILLLITPLILVLSSQMSFSSGNSSSRVGSDSTSVKAEKFDPVLETQKYIDELSPEKKAKSNSYFEGGYWIMLWDFLLNVVVAWIFLRMGLSKGIKGIASKFKPLNLQNLIYIGLYLLFAFLLTLPLNIYTGFIREHQYGLSNLTFSGWLGEELKGLTLIILFVSPLLMLLYIVIRKVSQNWWIWSSGIGFLFLVFGLFISPVFISPIFNKYKPLEEGELKNEILSLARANGIPANNVYQFDASKQSSRISANVSGIGSTIRISLNDNLLSKCTITEIKSVMAHEMGHYVLNHTYKLLVYIGLILFLGFAFINWSFNLAVKRWGERLAIISIADIGGLPLFMLLFALFFFLATPIQNNIIRSAELEADYFGLNAVREPDAFALVDMKLSEYRKISPGPIEEILFYDHPSGRTRIYNAMVWKAENLKDKEQK